MAVSFHSTPRYTKDLNVLVFISKPEHEVLYKCLAEYGAPVSILTPEEFLQDEFVFHFGAPPWRVELLTSIPGVDFEQAYRERVETPLGEYRAFQENGSSRRNEQAGDRRILSILRDCGRTKGSNLRSRELRLASRSELSRAVRIILFRRKVAAGWFVPANPDRAMNPNVVQAIAPHAGTSHPAATGETPHAA